MTRRLATFAFILACVVIVLGAYVRLSDAGLGCPDWPGCYGQLSPHHAADAIAAAAAQAPQGPVSMPKAWKEMVHRYLAATLGLLILAIATLAWRNRRHGEIPWLPLALVGTVIFQGLLGKWTVTLLLKPAIVTGHLIGGLATASLLAWLLMRETRVRQIALPGGAVALARVALIAVAMQILLGGWTSTNYAALACGELPTCQGVWWPQTDFANAFHVVRELGMTASGELLSLAALTAIHLTHRLGAIIVTLVLVALIAVLSRRPTTRRYGVSLGIVLALQIGLGLANVLFSLPLPVAVAHNAGALGLLLLTLRINYVLRPLAQIAVVERRVHENAVA
ncbi:COX15/CtaA family protein [Niveibacterium umoris]|uniref:Cytochrome c oxidase assembly protein subunit 15 n=1 Tax=Niveibacterium umoris TaxID=1193620 RepID=A0A840BQB6_9RHOO|nr:COX15/CtaA family protein [Niveibacterium umoris]MBB4013026.1 cytochrome c oxidase assembly protein subunit 15 [Niveibacterium umoris]